MYRVDQLPSGLAYTLLEALRRIGLAGTELARAQCGTIRLKLLKIGAVPVRNTRRVRFLLAASYPHHELFATVVGRLASGQQLPVLSPAQETRGVGAVCLAGRKSACNPHHPATIRLKTPTAAPYATIMQYPG